MLTKKPSLALLFEPDGYNIKQSKLMGRQSAGNAFLRAVIKHHNADEHSLLAYTPNEKSAQFFQTLVDEMRPGIETAWCKKNNFNLLKAAGSLFTPDPNINLPAAHRLRCGIDSYSITGITHTTASHGALDLIRSHLYSPLMPWDALICTSKSVKSTVDTIYEAELDYLAWRFGPIQKPATCQTPVIPLGIHTSDFSYGTDEKAASRENLGIEEDEIVYLFLGRLNSFMKAGVYPMYKGLQTVAETTGKKITLIECGWFGTDAVGHAMTAAKEQLAPNVRYIYLEGRNPQNRDLAWSSADVFVSLSDNIQETFGLTPVEAMAAGLPIIISDWDGYAELCTNGEEGFLIPTYMPENLDYAALNYEVSEKYEHYCIDVAHQTTVDVDEFVKHAAILAQSPDLRREMGEKGKLRAKTIYDWDIVYKQYLDLWKELSECREAARDSSGYSHLFESPPTCLPSRQSPTKLFTTYPTAFLNENYYIAANSDTLYDDFSHIAKLMVVHLCNTGLPSRKAVQMIEKILQKTPMMTIKSLANELNCAPYSAIKITSILLKLNLVRVHQKQ